MILYHHAISPYARKVLFAAKEKGVTFRPAIVAPGDWRRQAEAMNGVYPLGMTPVLVTDTGEVVAESSVIVEYLDLRFPRPRFLPEDAGEALRVRMHDRIIDGYLIAPAGQLVFERRKPPEKRNPGKLDALAERVRTTLAFLESRLGESAFVDGAEPRLSDLGGCAGLAVLESLEFSLEAFPRVRRWYAALSGRASWQAILNDTREAAFG